MRYPLSFAQERAWSLGPAANLSRAAWLDGPVDPVALRGAMDVVAARHAALRTGFAVVAGVPEQVVSDVGSVPVDHVVVRDVEQAESVIAELAARPFDLERAPLLRAVLVEVGGDGWLVALVAHRLVADDAALAILLADLSTAHRTGVTALPPPWLDYGDYAVWQRERLSGEELERLLDHWRDVARDAPKPLALPTGHPVERLALTIDGASARWSADVGPATACLAACAVVLARWARQDDVVIGVPVGGRVRVELEPIAGPFADVAPVRVSTAGEPTFGELLVRVRDATAHALSHDEVPLRLLADELGIDLPDAVRFAFPPPGPPAARNGVVLPPTAEADLELHAGEDGVLTLVHRTDAAFADWLLKSVVSVLEHATPGTPVAELPVLPESGEWTAVATASRPSPLGNRPTLPASDPTPTRDQVERTMAAIWAELIHATEPIGADDNLFGHGGGSLTAVRFASRIADTYGVNLPLDRVFTSPTVAALAGIVVGIVAAEQAPASAAENVFDLAADTLFGALEDPALNSMNFLNEVAIRYPDAIQLAAGRPSEEFFDLADVHHYLQVFCRYLADELGRTEEEVRRTVLQYGRTKGIIHELIARNLRLDEGVEVDPESVVVTAGCQEAMFLVLRALRADERDVLLAVSPTYVGLTGAARLVDLPVRPVRTGERGIDLDDLVAVIRRERAAGRRPRACYVMPDFANPSGLSLDVATRRRLLEVAEAEDVLLIEDNPYGLFHGDSARLPTLKALDQGRRVVYLGSFAKSVLPGARVGYVVADQRVAASDGSAGLLADQLSKIKSMVTVNTSPIAQAVVGGKLLANGGRLAGANTRERELYARNLRRLVDGLAERFPDDPEISWTTPAGGFFVVVTVPFEVDDRLLERSARDYGVSWTPMGHFYDGAPGARALRLSCSAVSDAQIGPALDRLAALLNDRRGRLADSPPDAF
ncbi:aminotransferase class I/II-fold pyridoxal phosphate-dependent enzyme [Saccharothrix sp. HUAS TT1]|uniref:aminotransferase class I/II-fold pyridoxal phosphate-dependent enzyme n=1 Tax=unclassified Saccharothrix TaxID=2593673 RepID=UPI00345BF9D7